MCEEIWNSVVGFEGYYSVSSFGRVRRDAAGPKTHAGLILRGRVIGEGYTYVNLYSDGRQHTLAIHCLVMGAFVGPRPSGLVINHKNGVKTDNRVENLEYVTYAGNIRHAHDLNLMQHGSHHCWAKLTETDVARIRYAISEGQGNSAIAHQFGVTRGAINHIRGGKNWRHVT